MFENIAYTHTHKHTHTHTIDKHKHTCTHNLPLPINECCMKDVPLAACLSSVLFVWQAKLTIGYLVQLEHIAACFDLPHSGVPTDLTVCKQTSINTSQPGQHVCYAVLKVTLLKPVKLLEKVMQQKKDETHKTSQWLSMVRHKQCFRDSTSFD